MGRWIEMARAVMDAKIEPLTPPKNPNNGISLVALTPLNPEPPVNSVDWVNWKTSEIPKATSRPLPAHPPTCGICGASDWLVALTDLRGRRLHVSCWKAEGGQA